MNKASCINWQEIDLESNLDVVTVFIRLSKEYDELKNKIKKIVTMREYAKELQTYPNLLHIQRFLESTYFSESEKLKEVRAQKNECCRSIHELYKRVSKEKQIVLDLISVSNGKDRIPYSYKS